MSNIIQLLPDHVANQIAAGEVVQRPASVVKELMENAIDAESSNIKLIIKDAGKSLIQVIDDGIGMTETDARMSFERHATSKIREAEDLFRLDTKGFRGEALASIAAIAQVVLKTKKSDMDLGTEITISGSKIENQELVTMPKGSSIAVKNLFFNIPARRNFLKSNQVEMRHIVDEFQRVALAHPNLSFNLYHNDNEVYNLPSSNLRQRIVGVFGGRTNEKLVPVEEETEIVKISGFVGKPEFAKKTRGEQFFFVNNRFIKSAYLNHAITSSFEGLIEKKMHPSYFLFLEINPKHIDINIHPTKTEIKFDDEQALYAILRATVKHSLGQYNIAPLLDFDRDPNLDTPYKMNLKSSGIPTIEVNPNFNPFESEEKVSSSQNRKSSGKAESFKYKPAKQNWDSLYTNLNQDTEEISSVFVENEQDAVEFKSSFTEEEVGEETVIESLFDSDADLVEMKYNTYQIHDKYVLTTIKSGLIVIDQNRAHQRILYENLLNKLTTVEGSSQQLLFPLELHFSKMDVVLLLELKDALTNMGFQFKNISDEIVTVDGVPVIVSESEVSILLEQLLEDVKIEVPDSGWSQTDVMAKSMAKSMAVRTGIRLDIKEQENLVNELFACKQPELSPSGKPVFVTYSKQDIDNKFI